MPVPASVHPWDRTSNPWVRLHIEYLGRVMGKMFLVTELVNCFRTCFATHGLHQICVSDNRLCFTNKEFECFMKKNSI